jgi:aryl-alcohol dehydrogenase-like predicted oxidoreductase
MEHRLVGRTGVRVSPVCLGTMAFGAEADDAESARMYARARDAGVNFVDTADVYSAGRAEEIVGHLIDGERDQLVLTSKVFGRVGPDVNARGLSRRHLVRAVEASLRRLGTDRLDFYFVHKFDDHTPIEETLRALDDLVRRGLVLYPAVSNWAAWQIAKALGISAREGLARFELIQPMYNLVKRQAEVELLPLAASERLGVIPYGPLAAGILVGRYPRGERATGGRLAEHPKYTARYAAALDSDVAERFVAYAADHRVHPATLAVAWVAAHPAVTAPILGARTAEQLAPSLAALEFEMTPAMRDEISALTPPVPPAHDRAEEHPG